MGIGFVRLTRALAGLVILGAFQGHSHAIAGGDPDEISETHWKLDLDIAKKRGVSDYQMNLPYGETVYSVRLSQQEQHDIYVAEYRCRQISHTEPDYTGCVEGPLKEAVAGMVASYKQARQLAGADTFDPVHRLCRARYSSGGEPELWEATCIMDALKKAGLQEAARSMNRALEYAARPRFMVEGFFGHHVVDIFYDSVREEYSELMTGMLFEDFGPPPSKPLPPGTGGGGTIAVSVPVSSPSPKAPAPSSPTADPRANSSRIAAAEALAKKLPAEDRIANCRKRILGDPSRERFVTVKGVTYDMYVTCLEYRRPEAPPPPPPGGGTETHDGYSGGSDFRDGDKDGPDFLAACQWLDNTYPDNQFCKGEQGAPLSQLMYDQVTKALGHFNPYNYMELLRMEAISTIAVAHESLVGKRLSKGETRAKIRQELKDAGCGGLADGIANEVDLPDPELPKILAKGKYAKKVYERAKVIKINAEAARKLTRFLNDRHPDTPTHYWDCPYADRVRSCRRKDKLGAGGIGECAPDALESLKNAYSKDYDTFTEDPQKIIQWLGGGAKRANRVCLTASQMMEVVHKAEAKIAEILPESPYLAAGHDPKDDLYDNLPHAYAIAESGGPAEPRFAKAAQGAIEAVSSKLKDELHDYCQSGSGGFGLDPRKRWKRLLGSPFLKQKLMDDLHLSADGKKAIEDMHRCVEDQVSSTNGLGGFAIAICVFGSVFPPTAPAAIPACGAAFIGDAFVTYHQAGNNLEYKYTCATTTQLCSSDEWQQARREYDDAMKGLVSTALFEAIGLPGWLKMARAGSGLATAELASARAELQSLSQEFEALPSISDAGAREAKHQALEARARALAQKLEDEADANVLKASAGGPAKAGNPQPAPAPPPGVATPGREVKSAFTAAKSVEPDGASIWFRKRARANFEKANVTLPSSTLAADPAYGKLIQRAEAYLAKEGVHFESGICASGARCIKISTSGDHKLNKFARSMWDKQGQTEVVFDPHFLDGNEAAAAYMPSTRTVYLSRSAMNSLSAADVSVLHEVRHSWNAARLRTGKLTPYNARLKADVGSLLPDANPLGGYAAFQSVDELQTGRGDLYNFSRKATEASLKADLKASNEALQQVSGYASINRDLARQTRKSMDLAVKSFEDESLPRQVFERVGPNGPEVRVDIGKGTGREMEVAFKRPAGPNQGAPGVVVAEVHVLSAPGRGYTMSVPLIGATNPADWQNLTLLQEQLLATRQIAQDRFIVSNAVALHSAEALKEPSLARRLAYSRALEEISGPGRYAEPWAEGYKEVTAEEVERRFQERLKEELAKPGS